MSLRSALDLPQRYITQQSTNPNPRLGSIVVTDDNGSLLIDSGGITSVGQDITIRPGGGYNLNIGGFTYHPVIQYTLTASQFTYSGVGGINRYTIVDGNALPTSACAMTQVSAAVGDAQTAWIVNSYAADGTVNFTTASQIVDAAGYSVCVTVSYGAGNAPPPVPPPVPVTPLAPIYVPQTFDTTGLIQSPIQTITAKSYMGNVPSGSGWAYSFWYSLTAGVAPELLEAVPPSWYSAQAIVLGNATYILNPSQPPQGIYYVSTKLEYFDGVNPVALQTRWSPTQGVITIAPPPPLPPNAFVPGTLDWNTTSGLLICAVTSPDVANLVGAPPVDGDIFPAYYYTLQYTLNQPEQTPIGTNYRPATDALVETASVGVGSVSFDTIIQNVNQSRPYFRVRLDAYAEPGIVSYSSWSPTFVDTTPVPPPPPPPPANYTPGALSWNPVSGLLTCVLTSPDAENVSAPPAEGDTFPVYRYTLQYTLSQPEQVPIGTNYRPATDVLVSDVTFTPGSAAFQTVVSSVNSLRPYFRVRLDAYSSLSVVAYTTWSPTFVTTTP